MCSAVQTQPTRSLPPSGVFASFPVNVFAVAGFLPLVLGTEVFLMSLCPLVTFPPDFREGGESVSDSPSEKQGAASTGLLCGVKAL